MVPIYIILIFFAIKELKKWKFDLEEMKSLTSNESSVVKISNLKKKYD